MESEEKAATNESEDSNCPRTIVAELKKQVKPADELRSPQPPPTFNSDSNKHDLSPPLPSPSTLSQDTPAAPGKLNGDITLPKLYGVSITPVNCSGRSSSVANETPCVLKKDNNDFADIKSAGESTPVPSGRENCSSSSLLPSSVPPNSTVRKVARSGDKKSKLSRKKSLLKKKVSAAKPHSTGEKPMKSSRPDEATDADSFQIKYTGTKKPSKPFSKIKKPSLKVNPFSPSLKRVSDQNCDEFAPEYAQYLGLQPIVKFKCSNCETSTFQSMGDLNAHKTDCKKIDRSLVPASNVLPESKSTNIKLTRKVFLCSACGTYYENWNLFLHMREAHRRYICLTCLGMFSVPEKLADHLKQKHGATYKELESPDQITSTFHQAYYALCLNCDRVFSEEDKLFGHKCLSKKPSETEPSSTPQSKLLETSITQETARQSPTMTRAASKRLSKKTSNGQRHQKKENSVDGLSKSKEETEANISDSQSRVCVVPLPQSTSLVSSEGESNLPALPDAPVEAPVPVPPPEPQLESSVLTSLPPPPSPLVLPKPSRSKKAKKGKTLARRKKVSRPKIMPLPITDVTIKSEPEDDAVTNQLDSVPESIGSHGIDSQPTKAVSPAVIRDVSPSKMIINPALFKKLRPGMESDNDSDDSQKLSLVVDESANNSESESKPELLHGKKLEETPTHESSDLALASEDVPAMALTLDEKIENVPIQTVVKECVRTSCLSCNYCLHASKIAVNGKYLAIHLLSEHRYLPVKNETSDDVVQKLKSSLEVLSTMFFNTDSYDNTDSSAFVPFNQDVSYDCLQCVFKCYTPKELFTHKKKMHTKSLMLCIMCKCNFSSYSELLCHLCPGHYDPEVTFVNVNMNFRCCLCRCDTIPSSFRLMVHLRKSHHTCDICLESCADQQKLSTHLWKHKTNHSCYRCGIAYASKPDITKHLFWKHGHESVLCKKCLQKKWPHVYHFCIPPSSFICEECNATFSKAVALKVHKRIHGNDYPYACTQCDKKFVSKKLLQRHEDRHNNPPEEPASSQTDAKDEIINVTDVSDGKEEETKEASEKTEVRDKSHKKHKKDKKEKKLVDVVDELPPLNLSSDSDSSDVEGSKPKHEEPVKEKKEPISEPAQCEEAAQAEVERSVMNAQPGSVESTLLEELLTACLKEVGEDALDSAKPPGATEATDLGLNDKFEPIPEPEVKHVEGIWENFYKKNPVNVNLPYPLCAMRSEDAYAIITHDHDYCEMSKDENAVQNPGTAAPGSELLDDKMEETNDLNPKTETEAEAKTEEAPEATYDKKKSRSPKKKQSKVENENSSSSSDSSSDSDSSDCTCGTNCSCSSSSSNSSSSSSSDSDTSGAGDKVEARRKKKREKRNKMKPEPETTEQPKLAPDAEEQDEQAKLPPPPKQPIDPPVRESELDTDETSTDEEFYDRQPQRLANQLLAEKRNQLAAAVAPPVNNGSSSPAVTTVTPAVESPAVPPPAPTVETPGKTPKQSRSRKRRRPTAPPKMRVTVPKSAPSSQTVEPYLPQFVGHLTPKPFPAYHPSPILHENPKSAPHTPMIPTNSSLQLEGNTPMSSESEKSRSSKRRRIPNKFYGYSSGEEEDKPPVPKVKKENIQQPVPHYKPTPIQHPPLTPRIQLNVSKTVIRKPNYMKNRKTPKTPSVPGAPDAEPPRTVDPVRIVTVPPPNPPAPLEIAPRSSGPLPSSQPLAPQPLATPPIPAAALALQHQQQQQLPAGSGPPMGAGGGKTDKDVYCYCRCPYDEVSEMIACDDENCKIEWFHFECVGILVPPRGQWYCPGCRKARGLPT